MTTATAIDKHAILTATDKPPRTSVNVALIPEALKWEVRWLCWKWEWRVNSKGVGKWDKPPLKTDGSYGSSTDPKSWSPFETAFEAYQTNSRFDGIGFVLGDDWTGIDIDDCRDTESSLITPKAESIIASFNSYTEVSPSCTGVKIFIRGQKREGPCSNKAEGLEVYSSGRYFTVTGYHVEETPSTISYDNGSLEWLQRSYLDNLRDLDYSTVHSSKTEPLSELEIAREAFKHIPAKYASDHRDWVRMAYAAKNTDESLRDDWVAWSRLGDGYVDDDDCLKKWNKIRPSGKLGVGTLVHLAMESGWRPERKQESQTTKQDSPKDGATKAEFELLEPVSIAALMRDFPEMRLPVVDGILRRGETANIIAAPKLGKSFLAGNLAYSVAKGSPWLGHHVTQGRVLIIDNELHPETLASRLWRIASDMQVSTEDMANVQVIRLRGRNVDVNNLDQRMRIEPNYYSLVILDALYRTIPLGTSENDNAAMMAIYNRLDYYADLWGSAIAVIHHSSKGAQGDKSITDVGAGAGAISRAADTHISIRPHEQEGLAVFEAATRSFKAPEPLSIKFTYPQWHAVTTPVELKNLRPKSKKEDDVKDSKELLDKIPLKPKAIQRMKLKGDFDFSQDRFNKLVGKLIRAKQVKRVTKGRSVFFQRLSSETSSETSSRIQSSEL